MPAKAIGTSETRTAEFYHGPADAVFDVGMPRQACAQVMMERVQPLVADRDGDPVTCISLTYRPGAADPLADGLASQFAPDGTLRYLECEFSCFNDEFADTYFAAVWWSVTALSCSGRIGAGGTKLGRSTPFSVSLASQTASRRSGPRRY
ncbi:hypothetical protein [Nocardia sp. NPDC051570]|uniref:hypothetical protein n=1 Tax=Nocardia sp. NPDC051570 TaxID=3364324 RepID=UPI0037BD57E8